jgi:hypothetical protein
MAGVNRWVVLILALATLAFLAQGTTALAQAGSTGGSIGKTDKSISGGEPAPAPRQAVTKQTSAPKPQATARYVGCFKDQQKSWLAPASTEGRDVNGFFTNDSGMTSARCISVCRSQGFKYAGTQDSTQCFCGNAYGRSGAASNCNEACGGNPAEMCGGNWANSIYRVQ